MAGEPIDGVIFKPDSRRGKGPVAETSVSFHEIVKVVATGGRESTGGIRIPAFVIVPNAGAGAEVRHKAVIRQAVERLHSGMGIEEAWIRAAVVENGLATRAESIGAAQGHRVPKIISSERDSLGRGFVVIKPKSRGRQLE